MKHTVEEIAEMARDNVEKYFGKDSKQVAFMGLPDLTILVIELLEKFVENGSFFYSIHEKLRSISIYCANGNLNDCAKAINSLRKNIKVARDNCKGNRRYAFGCIYDALTFTPVEDLTYEALVNLWLAVSLTFGLKEIFNKDYDFIADLIWEKFEMLPKETFEENTTRLTADMLTEGDFNFDMD